MKRIPKTKLVTITGEPFKIPSEKEEGKIEDCTDLGNLLRLLVFNIPRQNLTMEDSIRGSNLVQQIKESEGKQVLEIEEAEHDWIKKKVDAVAPMIFAINAVVIKRALDEFERAHQPKGKE